MTDEAEQKFEQWRHDDPFPTVPCALLNSADIIDYATTTGMIDPFRPGDPADSHGPVKPASYQVPILGRCVRWDAHGEIVDQDVGPGEEFLLPANSIAFVTLEPMLRLPDYIAVRFNLKITRVYQGLLLGTGPLIDPGYVGKLSIPLHNLTSNEYRLTGGEGLIWMEFTKISWPAPNAGTSRRIRRVKAIVQTKRAGDFRSFPNRKNDATSVHDYLAKASPHRPVRSSIPEVALEAKNAATTAASEATAAKEQAVSAKTSAENSETKANSIQTRVTVGGVIAVGVALLTIIIFFVGLFSYFHANEDDLRTQNDKISGLTYTQTGLCNRLNAEIIALNTALSKTSPTITTAAC